MKWFVIVIVVSGAYLALMLGSANMLLNQTQQLQSNYSMAGERADQIAAGASFNNR